MLLCSVQMENSYVALHTHFLLNNFSAYFLLLLPIMNFMLGAEILLIPNNISQASFAASL